MTASPQVRVRRGKDCVCWIGAVVAQAFPDAARALINVGSIFDKVAELRGANDFLIEMHPGAPFELVALRTPRQAA